MKRSLIMLALGTLLVSAGVVVLVLTVTRPPPKSAPRAPGTNDPQKRIVLGPTSALDLEQSVALKISVSVPAGTDAELTATVTDAAGEAPTSFGPPSAIEGGAKPEIQLRPDATLVQRLKGCNDHRLEVTLKSAGRVLARQVRDLTPVPPRCGRFFGAKSIWNTPIPPGAKLDPQSQTWARSVKEQAEQAYAQNFPPTINSTQYSSPVYAVTATQKRVPVKLVGSRASYGWRIAKALEQGVPIPAHARQAAGADGHIAIWQPATDTMWELWKAEKTASGWEAQWGGRLDNADEGSGYFYDSSGINPGATATGLPLAGGLITRADLARGEIDHALGIALPRSRQAVWSIPAQRTDGFIKSVDEIPAGARIRIDPDLDIDGLGLPKFTEMMAKAAQRYGIYVRDTSPVPTFYVEDPAGFGGTNPWPKAMGMSPSEVLRKFPWDHLQVMNADLRTYSGQKVKR